MLIYTSGSFPDIRGSKTFKVNTLKQGGRAGGRGEGEISPDERASVFVLVLCVNDVQNILS